MTDTHAIEAQAQEANSKDFEEFMEAVAETQPDRVEFLEALEKIETDPVQALRDWYTEKGEWEEMKALYPEFCKG